MLKNFFLRLKYFEQETGLNYSYVLFFIVILFVISYFFDFEYIKILVAQVGFWGPLVIILAKILTIIVAPLSGSPLYLLSGVFFGFPLGLLYVAIGDFIGYTSAFYIGRLLGRKAVERFISTNEETLFARVIIHLGTFKGYIQSCFIFFSLPELLSYGAGLTSLAYWKFIVVLFPASCVVTGLIVFVGDYLGQSDKASGWLVAMPILGIMMMAIGVWFFSKNIKKV